LNQDRAQLACFIQEPCELLQQPWRRHDLALADDDEPMFGFVSLLGRDAELGDELSARPPTVANRFKRAASSLAREDTR
jgi:hypothetical protein